MAVGAWLMAVGGAALGADVEQPSATARTMAETPWLMPGLVLALGMLIGWVLDRVVRVWLARWAKTTPWHGDEIILDAVRGLTWLWVSLIGLHVASGLAPIAERLQGILGRAIEITFIISATVALSRIVTSAFSLYSQRLAFKGGASVVTLLVRIVLFTLSGLVILQTEGISITPVLTALGVGGLAVALALQDTLGNIFAGIHTLMAGQIRPGDFIKLDGENEGYVIDIGWRNTSIRTGANNLVVVPNKKLGESVVVNYSKPEPHLSLTVPVGVAYDSDLERVEQVLLRIGGEVAAAAPGVIREHPPAVRFAAFADSSIEARLVLRVDSIENFYLVRHQMVKAIHAGFREAGISIAFPTRTLVMPEGAVPRPAAEAVHRSEPARVDPQVDDHD